MGGVGSVENQAGFERIVHSAEPVAGLVGLAPCRASSVRARSLVVAGGVEVHDHDCETGTLVLAAPVGRAALATFLDHVQDVEEGGVLQPRQGEARESVPQA